MTGNQMMLSIAAIALLSVLILNAHRSTSDKLIIMYSNEAVIEATGIAQALFEEIQTKAFDENTTTMAAKERNLLTAAGSLGKDDTEVFNYEFDDIDDYHGFEDIDSTNYMGACSLKVWVYYLGETYPYDSTGNRTYMKNVLITVKNPSLPEMIDYTLKFHKMISY
jgi:hypothetical protein